MAAQHAVAPVDQSRQFIRDYINNNCIARAAPGSNELLAYDRKSYYTWQFYLRSALFEPSILRAITENFFDRFPPDLLNMVQLAGVESASTPLLTSFALRADALGLKTNVFSIRKEQKAYGLRNWIEGYPVENKPVIVIDDLTSNNHNTMIKAIEVLEAHKIVCAPVVYAVVYKSSTPEAPITVGKNTFSVVHMFSLKDFDLTLEDYNRANKRD